MTQNNHIARYGKGILNILFLAYIIAGLRAVQFLAEKTYDAVQYYLTTGNSVELIFANMVLIFTLIVIGILTQSIAKYVLSALPKEKRVEVITTVLLDSFLKELGKEPYYEVGDPVERKAKVMIIYFAVATGLLSTIAITINHSNNYTALIGIAVLLIAPYIAGGIRGKIAPQAREWLKNS